MRDAHTYDVFGCEARDVAPIEADAPARADQAADGSQGRGFAGAVGTQQCHHAALRKIELDAVQGRRIAVKRMQVLYLQQRGHGCSPRTGCTDAAFAPR